MARLANFLPWRRRRLERELARELQFHLDQRVDDFRRSGMSDAEARRAAALEFGGMTAVREEVRETWTWRWLSHVGRDVTHAMRLLRRSPGFTVGAVFIMALSIAASGVIFSLVDAVFVRPFPGQTENLTSVFNRDRQGGAPYESFSYPVYVDIRDRTEVFESLMAHTVALVGIEEGKTTRRAFAELVSSNYFSTLGIRLPVGRDFSPDEEYPGASPRVAIASHDEWQRHGLAPDFVGSQVRVNGVPFTVIGVAPPGMKTTVLITPAWFFPLGAYAQLINQWFQDAPGDLTDRANHALFVAGALRQDVTPSAANQRLDALAVEVDRRFPATDDNRSFVVGRMPRLTLSPEPPQQGAVIFVAGLLVMMALLVLGVACLNLANLMLARGAARRRELGIRQAIGGTRSRLLVQLFIEGLTVSTIGALAGLILAWWAQRMLTAWLAHALALVAVDGVALALTLSWRTAATVATLAAISAMCFALAPAWRLTRPSVVSTLREEQGMLRRVGSGAVLVGLQIGISMALVAVGGLFLRSAINATNASPGFDLQRLLVFSIDPSLGPYDEASTKALYRTIVQRVGATPGVEHASLASKVAFGEFVETNVVSTGGPDAAEVSAGFTITTSEYFETLRLPVLHGRGFTKSEDEHTTPVPPALISAPLADRLSAYGDVLGRQITLRRPGSSTVRRATVVGVVPGTSQDIIDAGSRTQVYLPFGAVFRAPMVLHVALRPAADDVAMLSTVRNELRRIDRGLPVLTSRTMAAQRDSSIPRWAVRASATIFGWLGFVALLIAAMGVYGLHAYEVARRTRELGIRQALGATSRDVRRLVLRQGVRVTVAGVVLGSAVALGIGQLASSLLYRVSPVDPVVLLVAAVTLSVASILACYLPARAATQISALEALRHD